MRAISVAAVMLYHADLAWMSGGFVGVEVFFVISGYLITTLLLTEHITKGSISLRSFWFRRARRLLPALFLLLAVVALAVATFYREEAAGLRAQLLAALTYCTNWFQILAHKSYFASVGRPSPLQHLWSLAIEEQFYLVWPLVLVLLLGVFRRRSTAEGSRRPPSRWIPVLIGAAAIGSALLMAALYRPAVDPSRVYYGTDTRAQGLLLGALLAFLWQPSWRRGERSAGSSGAGSDLVGLLGLVGLGLVFFRLQDSDRFVFQGGLTLVSILSLMAIAAAANPSTWLARVGLGNNALAAIGRRSYGLYLWHWPVYVFTRPGLDQPLGTYETLTLRVLLTGVAAELSYRYVEVPIRNGAIGRWLAALHSANPARRAHRRRGVKTVAVGAAAFVVPVSLSLAFASRPVGTIERSVLSGGRAEPGAVTAANPAAAVTTAPPTSAPPGPAALPPLKNRRVTVIADSVLFSGRQAITQALDAAGWQVEYRGHPALMLHEAEATLASAGAPVGATVVLGIGYNSLWEHDRAHFQSWSDKFDREAEKLLATLTRLGAERFIWVTLREPSRDVIPPQGMDQYKRYVWYFPYVNERLRALSERHPNLTLADWAAVSNRREVTYDAIHLTTEGAQLMVDTIKAALGP